MNEENKITIVAPASMVNKIACIKAIRTIAGLSLIEARDATERPHVSQIFSIVKGTVQTLLEEQYRILRSEGFMVGGPVDLILTDLRELASKAILQGEDELGNEILQLVLVEKLRRRPQ